MLQNGLIEEPIAPWDDYGAVSIDASGDGVLITNTGMQGGLAQADFAVEPGATYRVRIEAEIFAGPRGKVLIGEDVAQAQRLNMALAPGGPHETATAAVHEATFTAEAGDTALSISLQNENGAGNSVRYGRVSVQPV